MIKRLTRTLLQAQDASRAGAVQSRSPPGLWALTLDLLWARALVWVARFGRDADLTPEAHLYFADRYRRLAHHARKKGRPLRAERLDERARAHEDASGVGGPPFAAAMAMPRPPRFLRTDAVSRARVDPPDDAA